MRFCRVLFLARSAAVLLLPLLALAPLQAQITASIFGSVTDEPGAMLVDAKIRSINTLTNEVRDTVTNQLGYYCFPELPVGVYTVQAELGGVKTAVRCFSSD